MSEKIADKIRKLIAHADSTSNKYEAEAFMGKVHELLQAHGMSLLDVGKLTEDPVGVDKDVAATSLAYSFMNKVAPALGAYYGLQVVQMKSGNQMLWSVAGRESARVTFTLMLPYVQRRIQDLGLEAFRDGVYDSRMKSVTRIGNALALRIWGLVRAQRQATEQAGQATTGVNALVPVDLIQQALEEAFPALKQARQTKITTDRYAKEASMRVNLETQVGKGEAQKRLA